MLNILGQTMQSFKGNAVLKQLAVLPVCFKAFPCTQRAAMSSTSALSYVAGRNRILSPSYEKCMLKTHTQRAEALWQDLSEKKQRIPPGDQSLTHDQVA